MKNTRFYVLRCVEHNVTAPVFATTENELWRPDYGAIELATGQANRARMEAFHAQHGRCTLYVGAVADPRGKEAAQ